MATKTVLFFKRNISKLSDEELLTHYTKSGDTEYFGELYNRYIPLLYGLCLKYLQDEDRAQEAVMQLFEDLLPKTGNYEAVALPGSQESLSATSAKRKQRNSVRLYDQRYGIRRISASIK